MQPARHLLRPHQPSHSHVCAGAVAEELPDYLGAQRRRRWDQQARQHPYVYLGEATALIVGVGGIGHETARLCTALGMTVLGVDPRPEYDVTVEIHPVADLDTLLPRADFVIVTTPHTPETEEHVAQNGSAA